MNFLARGRRGSSLLALAAALFAITAAACGSDTGAASGGSSANNIIDRVADDGRIYVLDDLASAGAKSPKEYDVTGLPGAVGAWRVIFNQKDYEVRLYPDHSTAVSDGTEWADIVSGADAVVVGDDVRWEVGASDRRQCNRAAETPHSGCNYTARYGDFIILGNMVLLCEGANAEEALKACRDLAGRINPAT